MLTVLHMHPLLLCSVLQCTVSTLRTLLLYSCQLLAAATIVTCTASNAHRPAHGAPVAVIHAACKAALAEGVPAGSCDGLVQQLEAQDALTVISGVR